MAKSIPAITLSVNDSEGAQKELSQGFEQVFSAPAPQGPSEAMYSDHKLQIGQKTLEKLLELLQQKEIHKPIQDLSNEELMLAVKEVGISPALQAELSHSLPKLRQALKEVDIAIQKAENGQIDWSSPGASMAASIVLEREKDKKYEQGIEDNFDRLKEITSPAPSYVPTPNEPVHSKSNNKMAFYDQSAEAAAQIENVLNELSPEEAAQVDVAQLRAAGVGEAVNGMQVEGALSPVSPFSVPRAIAKALEQKNDETPTPFTRQY